MTKNIIKLLVFSILWTTLTCTPDPIELYLKSPSEIYLNDKLIQEIATLRDRVSDYIVNTPSQRPLVISFKANPDIPMGFVKDVKDMLKEFREESVLRYGDGVTVRLPIKSNEEVDFTRLNPRNVLMIKVEEDVILLDGKPVTLVELEKAAMLFLTTDGLDRNLPEVRSRHIQDLGEVTCWSKSIVNLSHSYNSKYSNYIVVYDMLKKTYEKIWNDLSIQYFKLDYNELNSLQRGKIKEILPYVLSET